MTKFFIPLAKNEQESESVYSNIATFINESVTDERIFSITYKHNNETMVATVGENVNDYYGESVPLVIAIFKGNPCKICLRDRGVVRGEPILVGKDSIISLGTFS